ncbi:hypothetical protein D3C75_544450 [compost metagenome]
MTAFRGNGFDGCTAGNRASLNNCTAASSYFGEKVHQIEASVASIRVAECVCKNISAILS